MPTVVTQRAKVKQTYYLGKKVVQTGKRKGYTEAGFFLIEAKGANFLGCTLKLPTDIPNTQYTIEHGIIYAHTTNKKGTKVKRPIQGKGGRKKVTVTLNKTRQVDINGRGPKHTITLPEQVEFSVPTWATITIVRSFLKNCQSAKSFNINGGENHPVKGGSD
jgi:hypothetical protein